MRRALPALLLSIALAVGAAAEDVDRIVAVVGETPILESEVRAEIEALASDPSASSVPPEQLRSIVLERLVDDQILLARAKAEGIVPKDEEVQDALESSIERMRAQFPGEAEFVAALGAEGLTVNDLKARYKRTVERSLAVRTLLDTKIRGAGDVTEAEARAFYDRHAEELPVLPERVRLAQIFIKPAPSADAESTAARALAAVRDRAAGGEDFAELAKTESDDPSAPNGGDLGYFGRGDMDPAFEEAAFALVSPGDVSGVVRSRFGYHIIQLVDLRGDRVRVRHILKLVGGGDEGKELARGRGEALLDSIRAGADFAALARVHSDDRASAARGGEIGVFAAEDMNEDVQAVLRDIRPGETGPLVDATDGFHIFRVLERLPEGRPSFEEARDEIRAAARQAKQQEAYRAYLDELRKETFVRMMEPEG